MKVTVAVNSFFLRSAISAALSAGRSSSRGSSAKSPAWIVPISTVRRISLKWYWTSTLRASQLPRFWTVQRRPDGAAMSAGQISSTGTDDIVSCRLAVKACQPVKAADASEIAMAVIERASEKSMSFLPLGVCCWRFKPTEEGSKQMKLESSNYEKSPCRMGDRGGKAES